MKGEPKLKGRILLTGGSGTLGNAIVELAKQLDCQFTIFSRDPMKQSVMRHKYPDLQFVIGDVRDKDEVIKAMAGHDMVIHAAAMKHIPEAEQDPIACYAVNVTGSQNVLDAALTLGIEDVVLITTDKACHPTNSYGCTKMMMERLAFSYINADMNVYLPRYGNVITSTGSVARIWQEQLAKGEPITVTDPKMTRFWLSPQRAAEVVAESLRFPNYIYVPTLPALSLEKMISYVFEEDVPMKVIGLRPGEKTHEELLTFEESAYAVASATAYLVRAPTTPRTDPFGNYSSQKPVREVERADMRKMLGLERK